VIDPDGGTDRLGPYANDVVATGLVCGFLGYVALVAIRGPEAAAVTVAPGVLLHGLLVAVAIAVAWVFGPETVRAVGLLVTAIRSPGDVTRPSARDDGDGSPTADTEPRATTDRAGGAGDGPDPAPADEAGRDGSSAQRRRMIQTQTPGLDAGLGALLALSLPAAFLVPALPAVPPVPVLRVTPTARETLSNLAAAPDVVVGAWVAFATVATVWAFGVRAALAIAALRGGG
jgi:hypothetical protein